MSKSGLTKSSLCKAFSGVCIIPLGRATKNSKSYGYPYEVSNIYFLEDILDYAKRQNLAVLYLSVSNGIVCADDLIQRDSISISSFDNDRFKKWSAVISEEISRVCLLFMTPKVYLMCRSYNSYYLISDILSRRGIRVYTPIAGVKGDIVKDKLR